jgi:hypothetical protein
MAAVHAVEDAHAYNGGTDGWQLGDHADPCGWMTFSGCS